MKIKQIEKRIGKPVEVVYTSISMGNGSEEEQVSAVVTGTLYNCPISRFSQG